MTRPGVSKSKSEEEVNIFRTYLERKLESDTLEDEARSKNLSLNEIEEQRTLRSGRKGRRKGKQMGAVPPDSECQVDFRAIGLLL